LTLVDVQEHVEETREQLVDCVLQVGEFRGLVL
jgi:hypothetical protein